MQRIWIAVVTHTTLFDQGLTLFLISSIVVSCIDICNFLLNNWTCTYKYVHNALSFCVCKKTLNSTLHRTGITRDGNRLFDSFDHSFLSHSKMKTKGGCGVYKLLLFLKFSDQNSFSSAFAFSNFIEMHVIIIIKLTSYSKSPNKSSCVFLCKQRRPNQYDPFLSTKMMTWSLNRLMKLHKITYLFSSSIWDI